jgi:hypothetical protein
MEIRSNIEKDEVEKQGQEDVRQMLAKRRRQERERGDRCRVLAEGRERAQDR